MTEVDLIIFWQLFLSGLGAGCVYAMVALGFVLCMHVSGVINFAQGDYVMLGAIVTAVLSALGLPLLAAAAAAAVAGGIVGLLQERLTLYPVRNSSIFIKVTITLGFAGVMRSIALGIGGRDPLAVPGFTSDDSVEVLGAILPVQSFWVFGATAVLLAGMFYFLHRTPVGRAVRACAENAVAARIMGINVQRLSIVIFIVGGIIGALVGSVTAPLTGAYWLSGLDASLKGFVGAIIADMRSPLVAVLAGLAVGIVESLAAGYLSSAYKDVIAYGILLAYLIVKGGLFVSGRALASGHAK